MSPISASAAQAVVLPKATPAPLPKAAGNPESSQSADVQGQKPASIKVDAAADAAAAAAAAKAEVNVQQYAQATKEVMQAAAQQIQGYLKESGRNLNVFVDESTGYYVARVVNPETGEVVRSLPSDETLRIARNIDKMRGMLVDQRA